MSLLLLVVVLSHRPLRDGFSVGKHILLADIKIENAQQAENTLSRAGFEVSTTNVDVSSRQSVQALVKSACTLGEIKGVIHAAGLSPSQAKTQDLLRVDLYGTAVLFEEFGKRNCTRRLLRGDWLTVQPSLSR
nr:short chain dehydrogenase [Raoultella sp. NCTC 9187]